MLSARDAWQATLGQLQLQLNRATFDTWLKGSDVMAYEDGEFVIRVRHAYAKDWLEKHLNHLITRTLTSILGRSVKVNYVVQLPAHRTLRPLPGSLWDTPTTNTVYQDATEGRTENSSLVERAIREALQAQEEEADDLHFPEWDTPVTRKSQPHSNPFHTPLNRRYTFDTFVAGDSNQFAYAAARAVAESEDINYNPLFIHGGVGLGKTHLLQAIGHICEADDRAVLYTTAEAFTNELVMAIRAKKTAEFRDRYRNVDVLLVDDIQFMAGKPSSEEEFYYTFNEIFSRGGQIVVAGDLAPRQMSQLDERLRSRFEGGLIADLQPPEYETRLAILEVKSAAQGTDLPGDVAHFLAEHVTANIRELEGLLTQVMARANLSHQPLTLSLARQVIAATALPKQRPAKARRAAKLDEVLEATASYHQLSLDDLLGKRRTKDVVRARHIAIYLAREETEASLPEIGEALGGRNHSTVLHGYQKIAEEVAADDDLREEVAAIRRQLNLLSDL
ncbi:MAG TPA: chromosomal replication initiator protein DnaA [Aggregatilineaceae bacterium]|nr:chromosomal replication initiator protein DnaA [Aggregatilineaceae bacterium]